MNENKIGKCYIVSGLQYGDQGKGTIVDYLVKEKNAPMVVRYGGGPQAAHHVVKPDGTWHCFSHYGSGMFWEQSVTVLSKYMIVYPQTLDRQTVVLSTKTSNPVKRLFIDTNCYILTPYHQMISRVFEILRSKKKGSTGLGVGQVAEQIYKNQEEASFPKSQLYQNQQIVSLQIKDLLDQKVLSHKLNLIGNQKKDFAMSLMKQPIKQLYKILYPHIKFQVIEEQSISYETKKLVVNEVLNFVGPNSPDNFSSCLKFYQQFVDKYKDCFVDTSILIKQHLQGNRNIVFQGSQGALLDLIYGFYPHTTKTICTTANVSAILKDTKLNPKVTKVGVLRCYSHRHGQGPFIPFDNQLTDKIPEQHNKYSKWQGNFKIGYIDGVALKYGIDVFQPDILAVTSLDRIQQIPECLANVCVGYSIKKQNIKEDQKQILDRRFEYKTEQNYYSITRIKKISEKQAFKNYELTSILSKCEPLYKNISHNLEQLKQFQQIQSNKSLCLLKYIEQVSQKQIHIVSQSPTWQGKTLLKYHKKYHFQ